MISAPSPGRAAGRGRVGCYERGVLAGVLLALAASVCWAFANVFVQRSSRQVGPVAALLGALTVGVVLSGAAGLLFDHPTEAVTAARVGWLVLAGVTGLCAYAGMFYAFGREQLTLTIPFIACWSLIAAGIGLAVFGERPRPGQLAGAAVVFAGVLLVSLGASHGGAKPAAGQAPASPQRPAGGRSALLAALLAGLCFGIMNPAMTRAAPAFGAFGTAALSYLVGLALGVPWALRRGVALRVPRRLWPLITATGLFETAGFVLLTSAGLLAPVALVAPVASLAGALTLAYALVFLGERPSGLSLSGAVLATLGVVVLAI
jgi:drug/metabolite transporter (DMT)-like permease